MAFFLTQECRDVRPTLPPLHALGLPDPLSGAELPSANDPYDINDRLETLGLSDENASWSRARHSPMSSTTSCTSSSRSVTPPSDTRLSLGSSRYPNFSLVSTTFDKANALIVIPDAPSIPELPSMPTSQKGKAFLVVGPAMEHFRHPKRRVSKAARVHPYRIVPKSQGRTSVS